MFAINSISCFKISFKLVIFPAVGLFFFGRFASEFYNDSNDSSPYQRATERHGVAITWFYIFMAKSEILEIKSFSALWVGNQNDSSHDDDDDVLSSSAATLTTPTTNVANQRKISAK